MTACIKVWLCGFHMLSSRVLGRRLQPFQGMHLLSRILSGIKVISLFHLVKHKSQPELKVSPHRSVATGSTEPLAS